MRRLCNLYGNTIELLEVKWVINIYLFCYLYYFLLYIFFLYYLVVHGNIIIIVNNNYSFVIRVNVSVYFIT